MLKRIAFLGASFVVFLSSTAVFAEVVSIEPPDQSVVSGQVFSVDISISNVTDLYAFQFDLGYDPTMINAIGITEGPFLPTGGPTFFLPGTIDNTFGTIAFNADTLEGNIPGVSGGGTIAIATFQAVGLGSSDINFLNPLFIDSSGGSIDVTTQSGMVCVTTPEPASTILLGAAFLCFALVRARRGGKDQFGTTLSR